MLMLWAVRAMLIDKHGDEHGGSMQINAEQLLSLVQAKVGCAPETPFICAGSATYTTGTFATLAAYIKDCTPPQL